MTNQKLKEIYKSKLKESRKKHTRDCDEYFRVQRFWHDKLVELHKKEEFERYEVYRDKCRIESILNLCRTGR